MQDQQHCQILLLPWQPLYSQKKNISVECLDRGHCFVKLLIRLLTDVGDVDPWQSMSYFFYFVFFICYGLWNIVQITWMFLFWHHVNRIRKVLIFVCFRFMRFITGWFIAKLSLFSCISKLAAFWTVVPCVGVFLLLKVFFFIQLKSVTLGNSPKSFIIPRKWWHANVTQVLSSGGQWIKCAAIKHLQSWPVFKQTSQNST